MTKQIPLRISERDLSALDSVVASGRFPSRSAALRAGLELLLREERRQAIDEAYRRGYEAAPQEEWVGEAGLSAFAAFVAAEERDKEPL
jgi:Arc/MetJ-type ribon-helix-helix transcriptional regulator